MGSHQEDAGGGAVVVVVGGGGSPTHAHNNVPDTVDREAETVESTDEVQTVPRDAATVATPHVLTLYYPQNTDQALKDKFPHGRVKKQAGETILLGRGDGVDVLLNDAHMSKAFARIWCETDPETSEVKWLVKNVSDKKVVRVFNHGTRTSLKQNEQTGVAEWSELKLETLKFTAKIEEGDQGEVSEFELELLPLETDSSISSSSSGSLPRQGSADSTISLTSASELNRQRAGSGRGAAGNLLHVGLPVGGPGQAAVLPSHPVLVHQQPHTAQLAAQVNTTGASSFCHMCGTVCQNQSPSGQLFQQWCPRCQTPLSQGQLPHPHVNPLGQAHPQQLPPPGHAYQPYSGGGVPGPGLSGGNAFTQTQQFPGYAPPGVQLAPGQAPVAFPPQGQLGVSTYPAPNQMYNAGSAGQVSNLLYQTGPAPQPAMRPGEQILLTANRLELHNSHSSGGGQVPQQAPAIGELQASDPSIPSSFGGTMFASFEQQQHGITNPPPSQQFQPLHGPLSLAGVQHQGLGLNHRPEGPATTLQQQQTQLASQQQAVYQSPYYGHPQTAQQSPYAAQGPGGVPHAAYSQGGGYSPNFQSPPQYQYRQPLVTQPESAAMVNAQVQQQQMLNAQAHHQQQYGPRGIISHPTSHDQNPQLYLRDLPVGPPTEQLDRLRFITPVQVTTPDSTEGTYTQLHNSAPNSGSGGWVAACIEGGAAPSGFPQYFTAVSSSQNFSSAPSQASQQHSAGTHTLTESGLATGNYNLPTQATTSFQPHINPSTQNTQESPQTTSFAPIHPSNASPQAQPYNIPPPQSTTPTPPQPRLSSLNQPAGNGNYVNLRTHDAIVVPNASSFSTMNSVVEDLRGTPAGSRPVLRREPREDDEREPREHDEDADNSEEQSQ